MTKRDRFNGMVEDSDLERGRESRRERQRGGWIKKKQRMVAEERNV